GGANGGGSAPAVPVTAESPPATPEEAVAGAATEAEGAAAAQASTGGTVDIVTPTGGESVTEGTILEWSVKVGDAVNAGDTVVEISTDKVDMELPSPASGTLIEVLAGEGDTVTVGQVIGRMSVGEAVKMEPAPEPSERDEKVRNSQQVSSPSDGGTAASPVARRVAVREGVDLRT